MDDFRELNWQGIRDKFRRWRDDNERRSEEVVHLWEAILESHAQKAGNESHLILEQVILAALDMTRLDIVDKCMDKLGAEFPESMRVMKFEAMRLEALQMYDEASDLLDEIIAKDETGSAPRKRKIAILKEKGQHIDVIKELSEYLKMFMSDQEAWHELCRLYLAEGDYSKGVFCMEEVLLHNPHSHSIYQRIAEIRYTMGGMENVEIARTYYTQALKLNVNNMRALYGLYLCCSYIANSRALGSKRKEAQKMGRWALEKVALKTSSASRGSNADKFITLLECTLGNLEIKAN